MALENLDKALAQVVAQLQGLAQAHGSEAFGLIGSVYQLNAIGQLIAFIPDLAAVFVLAWLASRLLPVMRGEWAKDPFQQHDGKLIGGSVALVILCIAGAIAIGGMLYDLSNLFSPLTWASAFDPQIAIAAHVLKLL